MNGFSFFNEKDDAILGKLQASLPHKTFRIGFGKKKHLELQNVLP